jgi:hypothetical protein
MTHQPSYQEIVDSREQHGNLVQRLIAEATDHIYWLDSDFEYSGIAGKTVYEQLKEFLLRSRKRRLRLLMNSNRFLESRAARFGLLQERFSEQITCKVMRPNTWDGLGYLLVDGRHLLTRASTDHWRGKFEMDAIGHAEALFLRFESQWDEGEPTLPKTTLGL